MLSIRAISARSAARRAIEVLEVAADTHFVARLHQFRGDARVAHLQVGRTEGFLRGGESTEGALGVIDRPIGPIADWPLYKSVIEMPGQLRIEWNTAPFGDD